MPRGHKEDTCQCYFCKAKRGETKGRNNPMYGKHLSEKTKIKLSKNQKGRKSHRKGKTFEEEYGKERAKEIRIKMSITIKNRRMFHIHKSNCQCTCCKMKRKEPIRRKIKGIDYSSYIHGDSKTRLYAIWAAMKARCLNPNHPNYSRYGGRGIKVCDEWRNSYIAFKDWALSHGYKDNLVIDRIDNDGNYKPSNVQFITRSENTSKDHY